LNLMIFLHIRFQFSQIEENKDVGVPPFGA
jgi:hypothetical protein